MKILAANVLAQWENWLHSIDYDILAEYTGEVFGGSCFYYSATGQNVFDFTPNHNYEGAFGDRNVDDPDIKPTVKQKMYDANGYLWIYEPDNMKLYMPAAEPNVPHDENGWDDVETLEQAYMLLDGYGYMDREENDNEKASVEAEGKTG